MVFYLHFKKNLISDCLKSQGSKHKIMCLLRVSFRFEVSHWRIWVPAHTVSLNVITNSIPEDNIVTEAPNHFQFSLQTGDSEKRFRYTHTHIQAEKHALEKSQKETE